MAVVSISETYDLSTVTDKMTLIGIHTPKKELIQKTYPGLAMNHRFFRIVKTDVVLACVSSSLAITPDMVGDNSQDGIAPEDMLNPILYKACSNDSWSTLEARLMGLLIQSSASTSITNPPLEGSQAFAENDNVTGLNDDFGVYYSLLSNRDGFRAAPVQRGVTLRGLVPLVFDKWYTHGENSASNLIDSANERGVGIAESTDTGNPLVKWNIPSGGLRGRPHKMPRINTTYLTAVTTSEDVPYRTHNGMGHGTPKNGQTEMPDLPPVMLGCIVMPPCRKTKLFYRMTVRTWISFEEPRPIQDITTFGDMDTHYSGLVYHSDYNQQSKSMDELTDMVDVKNGSITKIMEGR